MRLSLTTTQAKAKKPIFKDTLARDPDSAPLGAFGKRGYLILDLYQRLWPDTLIILRGITSMTFAFSIIHRSLLSAHLISACQDDVLPVIAPKAVKPG